ncbi:MAG: phosphoribosylglycinamide formyltransferase [Rhodocyclaceae bacterium]|nr:phosphoribosylglycinamide formyltransferase [Rhodocyclaceae bacterium]
MSSIVILISGRGSNMQAIVEAGIPGARIAAVISNRAEAGGLAYARARGIETRVVDHTRFDGREAFDQALAAEIDGFSPQLVVLAGFMRVLTEAFVTHYHGRMINVHPSLLPAFQGLHTHRRAIEAGVRIHGATVHLVTPELDGGPILAQAAVPVLPDDDPAALAARVLAAEHHLFPQVVRWFVEGRVEVGPDGRARIRDVASTAACLCVPDAVNA